MTKIYSTIKHDSGIPLGGIGTGTVEIREDGLFHEWQIFNIGKWSPASDQCCCSAAKPPADVMRPQDLLFAVRVKQQGKEPVIRYLALDNELSELHIASWRRCVEAIEYNGTFPSAELVYIDQSLPVQIRAEVFSSFIPNDEKNTGIPGFYMNFHVENLTAEPVEASILGICKNPASYLGHPEAIRHTSYHEEDSTYIHMTHSMLERKSSYYGDMTFGVSGGEVSHINICTGFGRKGGRDVWTPWGSVLTSYFYHLRDTGTLPAFHNPAPPMNICKMDIDTLGPAEQSQYLEEVLKCPLIAQFYDRIRRHSPEELEKDGFVCSFLRHAANDIKIYYDWGAYHWDALLCSSVVLEPYSGQEVLFTVSWHYPNHYSPDEGNMGHMYENWFKNSLEVNRYLTANFALLYRKTMDFTHALYRSTLGETAVEAVGSQLSTLFKSSWWVRDNLFGIWEGLGCCGFHTTDITYQGSFSILALFPALQKIQMIQGARFQKEDGRVHHTFLQDFFHVDDDGYARVDMNPQFVMMVYRDYLWTGDKAYLEMLWPNVLKAMDNTRRLDTDGDGLPDDHCQKQTYDVWNLNGCPSYISSLWIGALFCASRMAEHMQDEARALEWKVLFRQAVDSFDRLLWNGEYYNLWVDPRTGRKDESCMTDQLSGEWFLRINGLGSVLPDDRVKHLLQTIYKYSFSAEKGISNCTVFKEKECSIHTYESFHAIVPWTGIEQAIAGMMLAMGMHGEAIGVLESIRDRYLYSGKVWKHIECGENYYRAMSSWSILMAASGLKWNKLRDRLECNPVFHKDQFTCLFAIPGAWGTYTQRDSRKVKSISLYLQGGTFTLRELRVPALWKESIAVYHKGEKLCAAVLIEDGMLVIGLEGQQLIEGDILEIRREQ